MPPIFGNNPRVIGQVEVEVEGKAKVKAEGSMWGGWNKG
jgi:hypothetical protein